MFWQGRYTWTIPNYQFLRLGIPSTRDSKQSHSIINKKRRELKHLLRTSLSSWDKKAICLAVTTKCLKLIISPIFLGNSLSDLHLLSNNVCKWCNLKIELGSLLMFIFSLRSKYLRSFILLMECGNALKLDSFKSSIHMHLNLLTMQVETTDSLPALTPYSHCDVVTWNSMSRHGKPLLEYTHYDVTTPNTLMSRHESFSWSSLTMMSRHQTL